MKNLTKKLFLCISLFFCLYILSGCNSGGTETTRTVSRQNYGWQNLGSFSTGLTKFNNIQAERQENNFYIAYTDIDNQNQLTFMDIRGGQQQVIEKPFKASSSYTNLAVSDNNIFYLAYADEKLNHKLVVQKKLEKNGILLAHQMVFQMVP